MYISKQAKEKAKGLIKLCLKSGSFDESVAKQVVEYISQNKNNRNLQVLSYFRQLVKLELNKETAKIEFASAASEAALSDITKKLESVYKRKMRLEQSNNPSLIGGFKVTVGSDVYDFSIEGKLNQIKNVLIS